MAIILGTKLNFQGVMFDLLMRVLQLDVLLYVQWFQFLTPNWC